MFFFTLVIFFFHFFLFRMRWTLTKGSEEREDTAVTSDNF